ncbi:hypothetical protein E1287_22515 [Actinomadura sp. KC06]|uniref:hypothetical protein n=1 Tax=Actinomadura sp. KC06 TaxID=2530369 RepID=UPI00104411F3|nr:hypothetical protein [Actinomadura sp. KC06]TDD32464.1 hypothetical protein E1287_22515 [Actinomadura sp. KC06]
MTAVTFAQPGADANDGVAFELAEFIRDAANNAPRSLQTTLGPSEAGTPCDRRMAYKLAGWQQPNGGGDPLASVIGTGFHTWAAEAFSRPELGGRFLVEQHLTIAPPLIPGGHCDLYDTFYDRVLDWKCVGQYSYDKYRKEGPREQYRIQAHTYGLGWELAGRHPREVGLVIVPRQSARLSDIWVWTEPYDRQVAVDAIQRVATVNQLVSVLDPHHHPEAFGLIPAKPGHECTYCPYYRPGSKDLGDGCPGDLPPTT